MTRLETLRVKYATDGLTESEWQELHKLIDRETAYRVSYKLGKDAALIRCNPNPSLASNHPAYMRGYNSVT